MDKTPGTTNQPLNETGAEILGTPPVKRSRLKMLVSLALGAIVMVLIFAFLLPKMGDYQSAFSKLAAIDPLWIGILLAVSAVNIAVYPFTATAALPGIKYKVAFVDRQAGFLISNVVPGGGAVAVGTQYSILSSYKVAAVKAAAAVSADTVWTYLLTLGFPTIGIGLLLVEGRSTAGYMAMSLVGLAIVVVSIVAIALVLRSASSASKIAHVFQRPTTWVFKLVRKSPPDLEKMLLEFHEHASDLVRRRWAMLTLTNVIAQLMPAVILWAALGGLGEWPGHISAVEVFSAYAIAMLLTTIPITPGGLGTADAALIGLLVAFGADSSAALAADLVWRLVWFLPQLLAGAGAFGLWAWDKRHIRTSAEAQ